DSRRLESGAAQDPVDDSSSAEPTVTPVDEGADAGPEVIDEPACQPPAEEPVELPKDLAELFDRASKDAQVSIDAAVLEPLLTDLANLGDKEPGTLANFYRQLKKGMGTAREIDELRRTINQQRKKTQTRAPRKYSRTRGWQGEHRIDFVEFPTGIRKLLRRGAHKRRG